jgi:hypothetical protein
MKKHTCKKGGTDLDLNLGATSLTLSGCQGKGRQMKAVPSSLFTRTRVSATLYQATLASAILSNWVTQWRCCR